MRPLELSALWNRAECMSRAPCCWDLIKRVTAVAGQVCSADAWHDTREGTNGAAELPAPIVLHGYGVFSPMIPYAGEPDKRSAAFCMQAVQGDTLKGPAASASSMPWLVD